MIVIVFYIDVGFSFLRLYLFEFIFVFAVELGRIFWDVTAIGEVCIEYVERLDIITVVRYK